LDYEKNHSDQEQQRTAFKRQIIRAVELQKPLIVHSRKAADDTLKILKEFLPENHPVHVHCFSDSAEDAKALMANFSQLVWPLLATIIRLNETNVDQP
jgi:TatD DNase family protein